MLVCEMHFLAEQMESHPNGSARRNPIKERKLIVLSKKKKMSLGIHIIAFQVGCYCLQGGKHHTKKSNIHSHTHLIHTFIVYTKYFCIYIYSREENNNFVSIDFNFSNKTKRKACPSGRLLAHLTDCPLTHGTISVLPASRFVTGLVVEVFTLEVSSGRVLGFLLATEIIALIVCGDNFVASAHF